MGLVLNPFGVPGVITGAFAFGMAALVYFMRPSRAQNRYLSLVLTMEGVVAFTGTGLMFLTDSYASAYAWQAVTVLALLSLVPLQLLFAGTLDTPLVRPLRARRTRTALVLLACVSPLAWFAYRDSIVLTLVPVPFAPWEVVPGPGWTRMFFVLAFAYLVGTLASLDAWRRAPKGSPARARSTAFLTAFLLHDSLFLFVGFGPYIAPALVSGYFYAFGPPVMQALFLPLLAYGILKTQLFDIDLRIKSGVKGTLLAGAFLGVFLVASETAQYVLSEEAGPVVGILAAGLLAVAFAPLHRVAERLASAAMPTVTATPEYLAFKKLDVYRAALEGAAEDGEVTGKERQMLERLRLQLRIPEADARALEADVLGAT